MWAWRAKSAVIAILTCFFSSVHFAKRRFFISLFGLLCCCLFLLFLFLFCCCPICWLCEPGYSRESPIASIIKRIISYSARIPRRVTGTPPFSFSFADDVVNVTRIFMWILVFGFSFFWLFLKIPPNLSTTDAQPNGEEKNGCKPIFSTFCLQCCFPFFFPFFSRRVL